MAKQPITETPVERLIGDIPWLSSITGWTIFKISRLCRIGAIPGAFQAQPGVKGSMWSFRKDKVLKWLDGLEVTK